MILSYDPHALSIICGGYIIEGFADGTFLTVDRNEDSWMLKMGADGMGTRAKSNNRSGRAVMTLLQSSKSNDDLSALAELDELGNAGVVPLFVRDASGRTIITALSCWLIRPAPAEFGKEVSNRVWTLESDNIQIFNGGNA